MKKPLRYEIQVRVIYPKGKDAKTGKTKSFRVTTRTLYVVDPNAFLDSGEYRIVVRGGKYTVSVRPRVLYPWWTNPSGEAKTWYTPAPEIENEAGDLVVPYVRTDDPAFDRAGILRWLRVRSEAAVAAAILEELETAEP